MNVRFAENHIRFRLLPEEPAALLTGRNLTCSAQLDSNRRISISLRMRHGHANSIKISGEMSALIFEINSETAEALAALGPAKEGISLAVGATRVQFDVDLKAARRR